MNSITIVCVFKRILLTNEPICFSFTVKLLRGIGKFYNYLGGRVRSSSHAREIAFRGKNINHPKFLSYFKESEIESWGSTPPLPPPISSAPDI